MPQFESPNIVKPEETVDASISAVPEPSRLIVTNKAMRSRVNSLESQRGLFDKRPRYQLEGTGLENLSFLANNGFGALAKMIGMHAKAKRTYKKAKDARVIIMHEEKMFDNGAFDMTPDKMFDFSSSIVREEVIAITGGTEITDCQYQCIMAVADGDGDPESTVTAVALDSDEIEELSRDIKMKKFHILTFILLLVRIVVAAAANCTLGYLCQYIPEYLKLPFGIPKALGRVFGRVEKAVVEIALNFPLLVFAYPGDKPESGEKGSSNEEYIGAKIEADGMKFVDMASPKFRCGEPGDAPCEQDENDENVLKLPCCSDLSIVDYMELECVQKFISGAGNTINTARSHPICLKPEVYGDCSNVPPPDNYEKELARRIRENIDKMSSNAYLQGMNTQLANAQNKSLATMEEIEKFDRMLNSGKDDVGQYSMELYKNMFASMQCEENKLVDLDDEYIEVIADKLVGVLLASEAFYKIIMDNEDLSNVLQVSCQTFEAVKDSGGNPNNVDNPAIRNLASRFSTNRQGGGVDLENLSSKPYLMTRICEQLDKVDGFLSQRCVPEKYIDDLKEEFKDRVVEMAGNVFDSVYQQNDTWGETGDWREYAYLNVIVGRGGGLSDASAFFSDNPAAERGVFHEARKRDILRKFESFTEKMIDWLYETDLSRRANREAVENGILSASEQNINLYFNRIPTCNPAIHYNMYENGCDPSSLAGNVGNWGGWRDTMDGVMKSMQSGVDAASTWTDEAFRVLKETRDFMCCILYTLISVVHFAKWAYKAGMQTAMQMEDTARNFAYNVMGTSMDVYDSVGEVAGIFSEGFPAPLSSLVGGLGTTTIASIVGFNALGLDAQATSTSNLPPDMVEDEMKNEESNWEKGRRRLQTAMATVKYARSGAYWKMKEIIEGRSDEQWVEDLEGFLTDMESQVQQIIGLFGLVFSGNCVEDPSTQQGGEELMDVAGTEEEQSRFAQGIEDGKDWINTTGRDAACAVSDAIEEIKSALQVIIDLLKLWRGLTEGNLVELLGFVLPIGDMVKAFSDVLKRIFGTFATGVLMPFEQGIGYSFNSPAWEVVKEHCPWGFDVAGQLLCVVAELKAAFKAKIDDLLTFDADNMTLWSDLTIGRMKLGFLDSLINLLELILNFLNTFGNCFDDETVMEEVLAQELTTGMLTLDQYLAIGASAGIPLDDMVDYLDTSPSYDTALRSALKKNSEDGLLRYIATGNAEEYDVDKITNEVLMRIEQRNTANASEFSGGEGHAQDQTGVVTEEVGTLQGPPTRAIMPDIFESVANTYVQNKGINAAQEVMKTIANMAKGNKTYGTGRI